VLYLKENKELLEADVNTMLLQIALKLLNKKMKPNTILLLKASIGSQTFPECSPSGDSGGPSPAPLGIHPTFPSSGRCHRPSLACGKGGPQRFEKWTRRSSIPPPSPTPLSSTTLPGRLRRSDPGSSRPKLLFPPPNLRFVRWLGRRRCHGRLCGCCLFPMLLRRVGRIRRPPRAGSTPPRVKELGNFQIKSMIKSRT
jgi:hypothetical protein